MRAKSLCSVLLLAAVVLGFAVWQGGALPLLADVAPATAVPSVFDSPLLTPPVVPTPVPTASPQDEQALQFVAQRYGISLEKLEVLQSHEREYSSLDRRFAAYSILERDASREFRLLIDLNDGSITEDIAGIESADAAARQRKCGKFDRPLYERLQSASDQDLLPVAIWVNGVRGRSEEEVQQVLAMRHPEVREALARHAPILDLSDPALIQRVKQEYEQLKRDDIKVRLQPLMTYLGRRSISVFQSHELLPSLAVTVTKGALLALAQREDVGMIYLVEGVAEPASDTAIPTDRVAPLWAGLGIANLTEPIIPQKITIVENGNVAQNNSYIHRFGQSLPSSNGVFWHTTMVASVAASFNSVYRGMAPGATIISAGEDGTRLNQHYALNWALDNGAQIVNLSECHYTETPSLDWLDRAFDYTARTRYATITTAAGNYPNMYVCSPAKGWNVITVGGINNKDTMDWSDDSMYDLPPVEGSAYLGPGSPMGDREKPEVVAPAQNITALEVNNAVRTESGTSLAAPQAAGLAALLLQRNWQLDSRPTVLKAILMASAIHNIEGSRDLSSRDGAGSINATLADRIAQNRGTDGAICSGPCWWYIGTQSNYPNVGGTLYEQFQVSRGERVRVAIA